MRAAALSLALLAAAGLAANGQAAPAYVTDELVLGVYAEQSTQGQRLATLHSGASVETLAVSGESTQVRLPDGRTGWVKTSYLTTREPAAVRIKQLQDELDRTRATTPALAEAAERSEVARLTRELAARQAESSTAAAGSLASRTSDTATAPMSATTAAPGDSKDLGERRPFDPRPWLWIATLCIALACGFWLGYAVLARRIRAKFGGLKVY
ncbi:MAG TPA: TIGR04211 family SH3 domain-containing protein [Steroidobacteraceae bacterium]|nr:TIGR04211 family SH3 domain-containing protein [Steroidobacteraceae bacterium]